MTVVLIHWTKLLERSRISGENRSFDREFEVTIKKNKDTTKKKKNLVESSQ